MFIIEKKYTLEDLVEKLKVSRRTVLRDLRGIKDMGVEIKYDRYSRKYYSESSKECILSIPLFKMNFTRDEVYSLYFAYNFLKKKKNFSFIFELESFIKKLEEYKDKVEYKDLIEITDFGVEEELRDKFKIIKSAIEEGKHLEFNYFGSPEKREIKRKVAPWNLIYAFGKWYLIGYCTKRRDMRIFNLRNIEDVEKTTEDSVELIGKDFEEYKKDMFGPWKGEKGKWVTIFYDSKVSRYIKEKFFLQEHKIEEFEDGSIRLKIKVSYPEAVLFYLVLPFNYHAEIESRNI